MKGSSGRNKGFTISELLLVFTVVIIVGTALFPLIKYSRDRMDRTICVNNMREIGLALYIYAAENGGNFPPSLKTLYEKGYLSKESVTDCPASKNTGVPANPDYIYTAGLSVKSPSGDILVKDKEKNHFSGERTIMKVNGEVIVR
ncbi:MAG: type II secretion system protein [Candidatus Omnitrophota bacterium]